MVIPCSSPNTSSRLQPPCPVVFDDAALPSTAWRQEHWREFMADRLAEFDFEATNESGFYAKVTSLDLGPLRINRVDCSGGRWTRRPAHLVDERDSYNLCMTVHSSFRFSQGGADFVREPGRFVLIDKARPSECQVGTDGVDIQIVMPRAALAAATRDQSLSAETAIDNSAEPLALMRAYVGALFASAASLADPLLAQKMGEHVLDLAILGLKPRPGHAEQATGRGLKAARLASILAEVNRRYCDAGIGPQTIAAAVNISPRYLHQLLEERGLMLSKIVMELRLKRAEGLLRDPRQSHLRVSQIAYDCGFNDLSYFNRAFRAKFGETPGTLRAGPA